MKIAIIADTHFGCRKNSQYFMERQKEYFQEFFGYLKENKINTIIHLGDYFDNRKTVNFETLKHANECFIDPILDNNSQLELYMIVGNHDSFYKSSGVLTSTKLLYGDIPGIAICDKPKTAIFGDKEFLFMPWIFPGHMEEAVEKIKLSTSDVLAAHFDILGEIMQGNSVSHKGINSDTFSGIPTVWSGHFHKKSEFYVGSPYQMSFNDLNDKKRIIIYDTETGKSESVYLGEEAFHEIVYLSGVDDLDYSIYKNKIVRVIVKSKGSPAEYDKFIEKLEAVEPYSIDIKEEYLYMDILKDDDLDPDTDTLGMLLSSVDEMEFSQGDRVVVKEILKQLYNKANE